MYCESSMDNVLFRECCSKNSKTGMNLWIPLIVPPRTLSNMVIVFNVRSLNEKLEKLSALEVSFYLICTTLSLGDKYGNRP